MIETMLENFAGDALDARLQWRMAPSKWGLDRERHCLRIEPDARTDFWQRTHYGFQADNGHFLQLPHTGDFLMETHVRFLPAHQYDQAGLMVRLSDSCWLKTSVEYEPEGADRLGVVVTNGGYSDWSTQDVIGIGEIYLRIHRENAVYKVESSYDGRQWSQLRLAPLHEDDGHCLVECGLYACSPKDAGFKAEFDFLRIVSHH
ncbi:MAG: DUF1349 domain-containing protein [Candidatus Hydrogenedentes bacterium]|nr:DUF1349 domain-containing protein [Candidatus Hydrogenedentota bacterium]